MELVNRYTELNFTLVCGDPYSSGASEIEWRDASIIKQRLERDAWRLAITSVTVFVMDRLLRLFGIFPEPKSTARYFLLHVLVNAFISFCTLPDLIQLFLDPAHGYKYPTETWSLAMCISLHVYHMIFFRPLPMVDWVHHIVMVVVMLPMSYVLSPGLLGGTALFFLTGFPGGLDYLMLVLVKAGYMKSITEKRYNEVIQLWIRAPGCLLVSVLTWVHYNEHSRFRSTGGARPDMTAALVPPFFSKIAIGVTIASTFWNGLYFLQRVVANTAVRNYQLANAEKNKEN